MLQAMIRSNPQLREVIDRHPEIGHALNNPALLRQTMEAASNPEIMREMMRTTDRAMSNIEAMPEGFNALRRMYENVQEPLMQAERNPDDLLSDLSRSTANPSGQRRGQPRSADPNAVPLPNPWGQGGFSFTKPPFFVINSIVFLFSQP